LTRLVPVGRVGRPHGRDGSFFVENASEDEGRFSVGALLRAGGEPATVVESKRSAGRVVLRLDRPVERGSALEVPRDELPRPEEGSYFAFELVGLDVEEEGGRSLGRVTEVSPGVANDVLELDSGVLLPMVEACVLEVDLERRRIKVARGFAEPL
jgi:16S rRNA processing protein RimM